jgi:magnesium transporter
MQTHSKVAARTLEDIAPEKLAGFFNDSPNEWLLEVIPHMNAEWMSEVFERMNSERLVSLLESMDIAHTLVSIRMMNQDLAESMLNNLSEEKSASVKRLLQYIDHSVGAYMETKVFTLSDHLTVKEALAAIKKHKEQIHPQLFVLGSDRKLMGILSLSDLIKGEPGLEIKSLMMNTLTTLSPETPIESILSHQEWQDFYALPVVDHASVFLGAIRLETIRSILAESGNKVEEMGQLAISALGELYRLGLAGLLNSATNIESVSKE